MMKYIFLILLYSVSIQGQKRGFGPGEQDYGYATVREGAHMFWWLYHTTADVADSAERPLIMWLLGGPGASSCGIGNFMLVGPIDELLNERENTWVKDFNILFVDSPVGTGFSYVENLRLLNDNNNEAAQDLVELFRQFLIEQPKFKTTPFYVFSIGYGSKIGSEFLQLLSDEVKAGKIEANIKGLSASGSWISPIDLSLSTADYLYEFSLIDEIGRDVISRQALYIKDFLDVGLGYQSTIEWSNSINIISILTDGVDFNNIMNKYEKSSTIKKDFSTKDPLTLYILMNTAVKSALGIPSEVNWDFSSSSVLENLLEDFMLPVTHIVEDILNNTDIGIHISNGNLDLIANTPGQLKWINEMNWNKKNDFVSAPRNTMWINNTMEGYYKKGGGLSFYWINVAGQDSIEENPKAIREFLRIMTGY